jgi:hypothetical protein
MSLDSSQKLCRLRRSPEKPGDDPRAPYHKQHVFAENIERLLAAELGVDWSAYDKEVSSK